MWSGGDSSVDTRVRVSWDTVTLPTAQGGLGILDPKRQSRALLVKLLVRGLTPGEQPWKLFLFHGIQQCTLIVAGRWTGSISWIFLADHHRQPSSPFVKRLIQIWDLICQSLIRTQPSFVEEFARQPLYHNTMIHYYGVMSGGELRSKKIFGCIWACICPGLRLIDAIVCKRKITDLNAIKIEGVYVLNQNHIDVISWMHNCHDVACDSACYDDVLSCH